MLAKSDNKLLLHGIVAAGETQVDYGAAVKIIAVETVAAVITNIAELSHETAILQNFHQIIDDIHSQTTVIPFRYGSVFETLQSLQNWLREQENELRQQLKRLDGMTEMSVRVLLTEKVESATAPEAQSGREYLLARARQMSAASDKADKIQNLLSKRLASLAQEIKIERDKNLLSIYFLISRSKVEDFRAVFHQVQISNEITEKMIMSGDWCPFNFVTLK